MRFNNFWDYLRWRVINNAFKNFVCGVTECITMIASGLLGFGALLINVILLITIAVWIIPVSYWKYRKLIRASADTLQNEENNE